MFMINQTGGSCIAVVSEGVNTKSCEDRGDTKYVLRRCCTSRTLLDIFVGFELTMWLLNPTAAILL